MEMNMDMGHSNHETVYYTCSMHPQIMKDRPGNCPICGMTLIKKTTHNKTGESTNLKNQLKATDRFIIGNFETTKPKDTIISDEIELAGIIDYDQNSYSNIASRVGGRIEKLYINYKYQRVTKGQKIFDIYSPELLTEQQNFIYLISNDSNNLSIVNASKDKLQRYGMTANQIKMLTISKKVNPVVSIFSPASGIISGNETTTAGVSNGMQDSEPDAKELTVKIGDYIKKNEVVFKLVDNTTVWGIFSVPQGYANLIKINQSIKVTTETNEVIEAKVNFVETQLNATSRNNSIRVYLNNKNQKLPIGLRLQGKIKVSPMKSLWIDKTSMLSLGTKKIVFLKSEDGFKATEVVTGYQIGNFIQIISGLTTNDKIAKNAEYLIDSESFVKPN